MGESELKICDVLKYNQDIAPFPLVKIYSGVGSGKSYFAAKMITGSKEHGIPKQNVLIVTSRRSKVNETLLELGVKAKPTITVNGNLSKEVWETGDLYPNEYEEYLKEIKVKTEWGEFSFSTYNKSVVCTNAYISAYLRHTYNPDDPMTHIWNKFDAIIIDEVHSLVTDATYQPATYDVLCFIKEYLNRYQNKQLQKCAAKHLIIMSGTPQPFDACKLYDFSEELTHKMSLFKKCKNVVPKNIILIDALSAKNRIKHLLQNGEKVIYFTNHTMTESSAKESLNLSESIDIAVSFSDEEKRRKLPEKELKKLKEVEHELSDNSIIPDYVQLFVTTSRNKEGININNTDYHNMFVETHLMYDVVQMAGRVRNGVDNLFIITDAGQFEYENNLVDILFSKKAMVKNDEYANSDDESNKYLRLEYLENEKELSLPYEDRRNHIMNYVKYIEDRFQYIRYNVFSRNFEFFYAKQKAENMARLQLENFKKAISSDNNKFFENWFPESNIIRELSLEEQGKVYLDNLIGKKAFIEIPKEEMQKHICFIKRLFNSPLKSFNPILHLVDADYHCIESGHNYVLYHGKEDPRTKKKHMKTRRKP